MVPDDSARALAGCKVDVGEHPKDDDIIVIRQDLKAVRLVGTTYVHKLAVPALIAKLQELIK